MKRMSDIGEIRPFLGAEHIFSFSLKLLVKKAQI